MSPKKAADTPVSAPAAQPGPPPLARLHEVTKRFGALLANDNVSLDLEAGCIHAVVGENGAGKSTLLRILAGVARADSGYVEVRGQRLRHHSPAEAIRRRIGMVHQHFMLIDPFTVADNLVLGAEPTRWGGLLYDRRRAERAVEEVARRHGLPVDPRARVADLSVGQRQRVEILKVLHRGADLLILDEPTAVLSPPEVDALFAMLRDFRDAGRSVVVITHRLDEVMEISERVAVLRRGRKVADLRTKETTAADLARQMVGRTVVLPTARRRLGPGSRPEGSPAGAPDASASPRAPIRLEVRGLSVAVDGVPRLRDVDLSVRAGEIVGMAGVQGNGQSELLEVLAGLRRPDAGSVLVDGSAVDGLQPAQRRRRGLVSIAEDRHRDGLVLPLSVADNLVLGRQRAFGNLAWLDRGRIQRRAQRLVSEYDIRPPDPDVPAEGLSGGNQQKLVVARELSDGPGVLLAGQPTRGVDVGAVAAIHERILRARDEGLAVLLVSADLPEVLALSDRVLVLVRGRVVADLCADEATLEVVGRCMAGLGRVPEDPDPGSGAATAPETQRGHL